MNEASSGRRLPGRGRALIAALSLVMMGAVIGVVVDRHLHSGDGHANPAAAMHEMMMSSLDDDVDLTAEQRRQIDDIIAARRHSLQNAWQLVHAQLGAAADTVHQEIEAILTPAQRIAFREWLRGVDIAH
jgi:Spy/CpxP family protein refolding chaperone